MRVISYVVIVVLFSTGCSIAKTRFMHVDSAGNVTESKQSPVHGVPAMIQVPTHHEVTITQTDFFLLDKDANDAPKLVHLPEATKRTADVKQILMSRMVMIDPKRPASGIGEFSVAYHGDAADGKGHINTLSYYANDETIKNTGSLISTVVPLLRTGNAGSPDPKDKLVNTTRVIAMRRFPIDCSRADIDGFLMIYINGCNDGSCQSSPAYAR
jgi:hypothetical protein